MIYSHKIIGTILLYAVCISIVNGQQSNASKSKDDNNVDILGSAAFNASSYDINGIAPRQGRYQYNFRFNPIVEYDELILPIRIIASEQGAQFGEPYLEFGIRPKYKWVKMHLGYSQMQLSPLIMRHQTFLGTGVELNPGLFRFSSFYGRLRKPSSDISKQILQPQFKRTGWGGTIGIGTKKNYVDLVLFKAKDDLSTLSNVSDSLRSTIPAQENLITGITSRLNLFKELIDFHFDITGSAFTRNIRTDDISLEKQDIPDFLYQLYTPRITSQINWAGESKLTVNFDNSKAGVSYERINPGYRSLGINYLSDDVENITLHGSTKLFERKLFISGRYGIQHDNLNKEQTSKTQRNIGSINIQYNPASIFGLSLQYANFTIDEVVVKNTITPVIDSFFINQTNHNFNMMSRFTFMENRTAHNLVFVSNYQQLVDQNYANTGIFSGNVNYGIILSNLQLQLRGGLNYNRIERSYFSADRYGASISAQKRFFRNKLNVRIKELYNLYSRNNEDGSISNSTLYLSYRLSGKQKIQFRLYGIKNTLPSNSFFEIKGSLGYNVNF